jgi:hypothetical protein
LEARRILDLTLNPKLERRFIKRYGYCLYTLYLLTATYKGIKAGSEFEAYDQKKSELSENCISSGIVFSAKDTENCLSSIGLYFRKMKNPFALVSKYSEGEVDFMVAKEEKHFDWLEKALKAKNEKERDYFRGMFYGYPECCVKAYCERKPSENFKHVMEINALKIRGELDEGIAFASDFFSVCSPNCQNAKNMGRKWLEAVREMYGEDFQKRLPTVI